MSTFKSFRDAARFAQDAAKASGTSTTIQRNADGWVVHTTGGSSAAKSDSVNQAIDAAYAAIEDAGTYAKDAEREHYEEFVKPIIDDIPGDQDDWSRSDETGWFYDDD